MPIGYIVQRAVFVPGDLANITNRRSGRFGNRWGVAEYKKRWRVNVRVMFLASKLGLRDPATPKVVTLTASTWNTMDEDGLRSALKPVLDGLVDCGLISGDAPSDGHTFHYAQKIDRRKRGV